MTASFISYDTTMPWCSTDFFTNKITLFTAINYRYYLLENFTLHYIPFVAAFVKLKPVDGATAVETPRPPKTFVPAPGVMPELAAKEKILLPEIPLPPPPPVVVLVLLAGVPKVKPKCRKKFISK